MRHLAMIFVLFLIQISIAFAALPKEFQVIDGMPQSVVEGWSDHSERRELSEEEQLSHPLSLVRKGDLIVWASSQNQTLTHQLTGLYDDFVDSAGYGYIKIAFTENSCEYMEHHHDGFGTVTYWGKCQVR